jgi:competence ComEA-like helix-hairpin-helix protein
MAAIGTPRGAGAAGKDLEGVVNLNTATTDLLELLPGVGPAKVHSIVWYRQKHPFRTVDELVRIKGIGRKMVRRLRPHLAVSGPTTAQALLHARGAAPPPLPPPKPLPAPPPVARRPWPPARTPLKARGLTARERAWRSPAEHCARPP